jgi:catechol 2,3-dioxygenase-like lactoylglutathione lyase family enzyme
MTIIGPDFIALQVRSLEQAADFYESRLGLRRADVSPPGAVVFVTTPIPFAVREPLPGVDLD